MVEVMDKRVFNILFNPRYNARGPRMLGHVAGEDAAAAVCKHAI